MTTNITTPPSSPPPPANLEGASGANKPVPTPRKISRRKMIALSGAATLVLVAGGGVWRAADQGVFSTGEGVAYTPWSDWRTPTRGSLDLVRAAILAANPHNTQPWLFKVTPSQIELFADRTRSIGSIDPFLREMHMGLGCALENLLLAATANNFSTQVTLLPDASNENLVARIGLTSGNPTLSDLYNVIPQRHTNRYPYDPARPVTKATLDALTALNDVSDVHIFWFNTPATQKPLSDLIVEATKALVADKTQDKDSANWYQATWQDLQQHKAGITLDAAGLSDMVRALGKMLPPASQEQQDTTFVQNTTEQAQTAGAFGLLAVHNGQDRTQQLRAGQVWERMHLWMTKEGLAAQPLNAVVERASREVVLGSEPHFGTALQSLVADASWQTLLAFRIGYSTHEGLLSPRRGVNEVLKA